MIVFWAIATIMLGVILSGIILVRASGLKRRNLFIMDVFLVVFAPALLFIAYIEFVVVPSRRAEIASTLYPMFLCCWLIPASLLINRRLKIYYA